MTYIERSKTNFSVYILPTLNETSRDDNNYIAIAGRITQAAAAIGIVLSTAVAAGNLLCIVTGVSLIGASVSFVFNATKTLACYELFQMASNATAIYNSTNRPKTSPLFTQELTKNTYVVQFLNPTIEQFLNSHPDDLAYR